MRSGRKQDMSSLKVVYQWPDSIYVKEQGLRKDKAALLIIIGALTNGKKVFLACESLGIGKARNHGVRY